MSLDMYREIIIDHYKNPRNFGEIKNSDGKSKMDNPLCGDRIKITYMLDDSKKAIKELKFSGTGCSLTLAGASILTEFVIGKTIKELRDYSDEDFLKDLKIPISPARRKCALLGLQTLRQAIGIE